MGRIIYNKVTWENLDWNKFQTRIFSLQCKIYEAMEQNEINEVFRLQNLILLNPASYWLAVRSVSSLDARVSLPLSSVIFLLDNPKFFSKLIKSVLFGVNKHCASYSSLQMFFDTRVVEFVWRLAIEPTHELTFSPTSYGLRPGHTYLDLQLDLLSSLHTLHLESRYQKVFSVQIAMPFSSLNYRRLLSQIVLPFKYKRAFVHALKLGLQDRSDKHLSYLIPLVLHIALDGIEHIRVSDPPLRSLFSPPRSPKYTFRYANHILFLLPFYEEESMLLDNLVGFLALWGLKLKQYKVFIVDLKQGFPFLDWLFKSNYSGRIHVYPTFTNCKTYTQKVKCALRNTYYSIKKRIVMVASTHDEWIYYNGLCTSTRGKHQFAFLKVWCRSYLRLNTQLTSAAIGNFLTYAFS